MALFAFINMNDFAYLELLDIKTAFLYNSLIFMFHIWKYPRSCIYTKIAITDYSKGEIQIWSLHVALLVFRLRMEKRINGVVDSRKRAVSQLGGWSRD